MDSKWRETFLLHSQTESFKNRLNEALTIIEQAINRYKKPYIAYSGGKDSTCVMHMVLQRNPDVMVLHWDYGRYYIPRPLHEEIIAIAKSMNATLRVETAQEYETLGRKAINVLGTKMIGELIPRLMDEGYDAVFVGLRCGESVKRKLRINSGRTLTAMPEIFPVQNWSWLDVWAYIVSRGIPYLSHYDRYGEVIGWDRVRFTTLFDPEFDKFGCSNIDGVLSWKFRNLP